MLEIQCLAEDFLDDSTGKRLTYTPKNISDAVLNVRLPRYELSKFHGDNDSTKLSYLGFCLCGSALTAISDLSITAANNSVAIEILKNRYDGTKLHKNVVGSVKPLAVKLQLFHDKLNLHVRAVGAPGKGLSSMHISFYLFTKSAERLTTTAALEAKIETTPNTCAIFHGAHIYHCQKFMKTIWKDRWSCCEQQGLCFHCLRSESHIEKYCLQNKKLCNHPCCNGNHHQLLQAKSSQTRKEMSTC
ncbi:hypothetical protein T10_6350 [Trichinella papuae]|uniref:Uncharacterized protein n=1 Tax=Trichinella papuae TaxID=268474 RepID=A0A0V1N2R2_9BILA|nr:hypothetical protein T10_6350 [Trichinella papuae]